MSSQKHEQLLRQAIEAAREGDNSQARELLEQILEADEENVKAWMWMYRVSDDVDEKRIALTNVVQLDPTNTRAKELLEKLERVSGSAGDDDEVAPGVSRRQLLLFGGGALLVIVLLIVGAVAINLSRQQAVQSAEATSLALLQQPTNDFATQQAAIQQQTADVEGTQAALRLTATETPTLTATSEFVRTLPPTFTETPTPTPLMSATPLPPPSGLSGSIVGWGGPNTLNDGYFEIQIFPLNNPGAFSRIGEGRGRYTTAGGKRIAYTRWYPDVFAEDIQIIDPDVEGPPKLVSQFYASAPEKPGNPQEPQLSSDGTKVVFVGQAANMTYEIYIVDLTVPEGGDGLRRLTNDTNNYSFPSFSPDGTQIIAVMETAPPQPPLHDLVIVDVASGTLTSLTIDGMLTLETHPRFSNDGQFVTYAARMDPLVEKHDIYFRRADGFGDPIQVTKDTGADNIHPIFSPDGKNLAFASNRRGTYVIYVYNLETGTLSQLIDSRDNFFPGGWMP